MLKTAAIFGLLGGAQSQSVTSCGAAGDHFSNVKITLSPDPPVLGQPFSFNMEGDLDEALAGGDANIDLTVKALGIINEPVKASSPFTYSPGVASGHSTVAVGPVNLPKVPLPGGVDVTGTVKIANTKNEPVACIQMDLKIGGVSEASALETPQAKADASPVTDCTKPTDHMKNFKFSDDSTGMTTITGTLDEDVGKLDVGVDLNIKVPLVPLPEIKLSVPASISPAMKKGDLKITVGPVVSEVPANGVPITVNGNVKVNDGNAEEIVCLQIASNSTQADSTTVTHAGTFSQTSMLTSPGGYVDCDGARSANCKVCARGKVCVENDYKSQAECLDCTKEENHKDCVDAGCLAPDPGPCVGKKTCQGCAAGKVCVGGACLDCNAQQNYQACTAAGCGSIVV